MQRALEYIQNFSLENDFFSTILISFNNNYKNQMSTDDSGIHLIKRAIELETEKRYVDSLVCYKEGIQALLDFIKGNYDSK